jgi:hypothetical protein
MQICPDFCEGAFACEISTMMVRMAGALNDSLRRQCFRLFKRYMASFAFQPVRHQKGDPGKAAGFQLLCNEGQIIVSVVHSQQKTARRGFMLAAQERLEFSQPKASPPSPLQRIQVCSKPIDAHCSCRTALFNDTMV